MEPLVARAFFTLLMSPEQVRDLKAWESTLPPSRYLQGFELVRRYGLSGGALEENREAMMLHYLEKWRALNWKKNQIEETETHDKNCINSKRIFQRKNDHYGWCKCRTRQQEIHEWMDYILKHWSEPLPALKRRSVDKFEKEQTAKSKSKRYGKDSAADSAEPEQSEMDEMSEV